MKKSIICFFSVPIMVMFLSNLSYGIDTKDARMLSRPAISSNHVAFIYAEDLWIADLDGKNAPEEPVRSPYPVRVRK